MEGGSATTVPGEIYIDCTAAGVRPTTARPIFTTGRIILQYVTIGMVPWSAATVGVVEAFGDDDAEKNRLCNPVRLLPATQPICCSCRTPAWSGSSPRVAPNRT